MGSLEPISYEDFVFEEDGHLYRLPSGEVRPSITQMMSRVGIYDYSHVPPEILENARRRGSNVHKWCAEFDIHGWVDETWIAEDEMGYFEAWLKFRRETKIVIRKVETPMLRPIAGVLVGGTPDVIGFIGATLFTVERKACRAKHPGWAIQTALQEMLETGKTRVGHMGRMSVQLKPDGNYSAKTYEDPTDGDVALAIVQKSASEESIATWARNNNLKLAA
jgi:hypothetical protein